MALKSWSSPAAGVLLLVTLVLSAAASSLAQQAAAPPPPPPEPYKEPGTCPDNINEIIVAALGGKPVADELQQVIDEIGTSELAACVYDNIVNATGIANGTPAQAINKLVDDVLVTLTRPTEQFLHHR